jgi:hypothetical protein
MFARAGLPSRHIYDYVIFRDVQDLDHYVQYTRHDRAIYGEVGSLTLSGKRQLRPPGGESPRLLGLYRRPTQAQLVTRSPAARQSQVCLPHGAALRSGPR